jgi:class 3 adenylate cyclase
MPVHNLDDDRPTTMQQIADWLKNLDLGQYAQRFAENDIDVSVLRHLTDADLERIGVSLGHRRKILAALAELGGARPSKHESPGGLEPKPQDTAERRQVTVMFADLVGSTALSASMDPEDLREVIAAYHRCAAETVRRFDGFLAQFLGDGVLVFFSYPQHVRTLQSPSSSDELDGPGAPHELSLVEQ